MHSHHHDHHGHHHHHHDAAKNIKLALFLNLFFSIVELIGGLYTQSVAILSDAVHDFGDTMSLGFSYFLEKKSQKSSNDKFSYGYKRLSLLSAVITAIFLIVASIFVLIESFERLFNPIMPKVEGMILLSFLGIAVNGYAAWKTSHGENMNEKVISWHMIEDLLGWIVVLIGSLIMMFIDIPILDPILSIGFSLFIMRGVYKTLMATIRLFLQAVPAQIDLSMIINKLTTVDGVSSIHDCHIWSLDGESHVLTLHAVVSDHVTLESSESIKRKLKNVAAEFGKFHLTVELELANAHCSEIDCVKI